VWHLVSFGSAGSAHRFYLAGGYGTVSLREVTRQDLRKEAETVLKPCCGYRKKHRCASW